ncbi:MAG TPA: type II toxin-antitoxin system RelE/ParE family toxin [Sporichthyaceae bacterium]
MTRRIQLEAEAIAELEDAALWYDQQHPGLGARFLAAVEETLDRLGRWPEAAPLVDGLPIELGVRRAAVRQFPYRIAYLVLDETIRVLAIAHTRRAPGYWQQRADGPRRDAAES